MLELMSRSKRRYGKIAEYEYLRLASTLLAIHFHKNIIYTRERALVQQLLLIGHEKEKEEKEDIFENWEIHRTR